MWTRLKRISSVIFVITHLMPNDTFWITKPKFTTNINMFATSVEKDSGKFTKYFKILFGFFFNLARDRSNLFKLVYVNPN